MNLEYPFQALHGNLAVTREQEVYAFYTVPYFSTTKEPRKKEEMKALLTRVFRKLEPNRDFEISLVPRDFLLQEKMEAQKRTLYPPYQKAGKRMLEETVYRLTQEMEIPYKYEWLLVVRLVNTLETRRFSHWVEKGLERVAIHVMRLLGKQIKREENWAEAWEACELELRQTLSSLKPVPLNEAQLFYAQRLQFLPYIPHKYEEVLERRMKDNVTDTYIGASDESGEMHFIAREGESYVSILPLGKGTGVLTASHLGEVVQRFNFPVALKIKVSFAPKKTIKAKLTAAFVRIKSIARETANTGNVLYDRIILGRQSLVQLAKNLEEKEPTLEYGMFLVVAARTEEVLRLRVKTVLNSFENAKIDVSRARFDQPYLFQALLYGQPLEMATRFWRHYARAKGFAEHLEFTTTKSGSGTGFYIGRVDSSVARWEDLPTALAASRNLVLYTPMLANKENIAGKVTKNLLTEITGETGSGKSILAQMQFLQSVMTTVKTLYVDPKRAIRRQWLKVAAKESWVRENPSLAQVVRSINYVTLDYKDKSNQGVLDPIVFLDAQDAVTVAKTMLRYLGENTWTRNQSTALSKAVKAVVERREAGAQVGFMQVIDVLKNDKEKEIKEAGEALFEMVEGSILSLAFSDGKTPGLSFEAHATVLEIADLELPDLKEEELTEDERYSVALMMALGVFAKRFGEMDIKEETIEFMDEVWMILRSKEGRKIVKSMKRVGRSQNNKLVLISQSINDDKDEEDTTGAGERFAFYERGEEQAILETLKLEENEENLAWIRNMVQGQCLYSDVFGNLNRISIDVLPSWLELFSPEEDTEQSKIEKKYQSI
jgi:hypothetical protein